MEVGEYVRTEEGNIGKIIRILERVVLVDKLVIDLKDFCVTRTICNSEIVKRSKNIIDLIEVRRLCEWA